MMVCHLLEHQVVPNEMAAGLGFGRSGHTTAALLIGWGIYALAPALAIAAEAALASLVDRTPEPA